jgi:phosphoglycolate phosphatase-like HAD superfamily hydrolase
VAQSLSLWEETPTKQAILDFVDRVTADGAKTFVAPDERVATFDNDGTLWCEQPLAQGAFIAQRLAAMAKADPSLRQTQPWKAISDGDSSWINNAVTKHYNGDDTDLKSLIAGVVKAFGDITVEGFETQAATFYDTAVHPVYKQPYQKLGYMPMVELLDYLESKEFTCYIVSGGGRDFMRPVTQSMYGIPPERVVGSSSGLTFKADDNGANVIRSAAAGIIDDGPGKPIQIWERIGRRPILAAGNANGDVPMLQFAADQSSPTLCLLVHHDDAVREVAYSSGAENAVKAAGTEGWTVISMKRDWSRVFSFQ